MLGTPWQTVGELLRHTCIALGATASARFTVITALVSSLCHVTIYTSISPYLDWLTRGVYTLV